MKISIATLLVVTMLLGMTACGSTSSSSETTAAATDAAGTEETASEATDAAAETNGSDSASDDSDFDYPNQTVTIINPSSAGGAYEIGTRIFMKYAQEYCDQDIVITSVEGGNGLNGPQYVLDQPADGYYICLTSIGPQFLSTEDTEAPWDFMEEFEALGLLVSDDRMFAIRSDDDRFGSTPEEFVEYCLEHPGEVTIAVAGGTNEIPGMSVLALMEATGIELTMVPYEGSSDAKAAFLGGHTDLYATGYADAMALVDEDQANIVCVISDEREPGLPDVPTCQELGWDIQTFSTDRGLFVKAGTDSRIIEYWENIMEQVCNDPDYIAELEELDFKPNYKNADELEELCAENLAFFAKMLGTE